MLSELVEIDLHTQGSTLGFADHLDNYKSMRYSSSGGSGSGISNNRVFGNGTDHQTTYSINQNGTVINSALQYKMGRYIDTSGNANGLGSVLSTTQMANEARPYFTRSTDVSGSYMIWYDVAVIKLSTIFLVICSIIYFSPKNKAAFIKIFLIKTSANFFNIKSK